MDDSTPCTRRRAATQEFLACLASPTLQRALGGDFGSAGEGSPDCAPPASAADTRLQQTLASIMRKDGLLAEPLTAGGIAAYPAGSRARELVGDMLTSDLRSQLHQYAQQLAAKDAEAAALRLQVGKLKQGLGASEGKYQHATDQLAQGTAAQGQLEAQLVVLEKQVQQRESELAEAAKQKRAVEHEAAAARAQAVAVQNAAKAKAEEWDKDRRYLKDQLQQREAELSALEQAVQSQAAEAERRTREGARREGDLSAAQLRAKDSSAAAQAELGLAQEKLDQALKRVRLLEGSNSDLRKQKAQLMADMQVLEELLGEADSERKELHEKYCRMGEHMEVLVRESHAIKESACQESEAARVAVEAAAKGKESVMSERSALVSKAQSLAAALEAEQASRAALKDKAARKLAAAEAEVAHLRAELEGKARQVQALQGELRALQTDADSKLNLCEAQVAGFKDRLTSLSRELDSERKKAGQARDTAEGVWQDRLALEMQQQALKYERRIQELELQWTAGQGGGTGIGVARGLPGDPSRGSVLDYIPRTEHVRLMEARLAAKEADMQLELAARVHQAEREWQWKVEGKETEIGSLSTRLRQLEDDLHAERHKATSHAHKLGDEAKRSAAQCVELQRELEAQGKELTRLKEMLKDARSANADMDDGALTTNRQVARLRHALEDSQTALKEAQAALAAERKRVEDQVRETKSAREDEEDARRRAARLEGEMAQLAAALEQKQEMVVTLQAECEAWGCKLMAGREGLAADVEAARQQARQEQDARLAPLEQHCLELAAELQEARQAHDAALTELGRRHAAEVGALATRVIDAARREDGAHQVARSLSAGRQQDAAMLQASIQELQSKLSQAQQQLSRERAEHQARLVALATELKGKLAALVHQQKTLKAQVQGEVVQACSDCLAMCEAGLNSLKQQLQEKTAAAAATQEALTAQVEQLRTSLRHLVAMLGAELPQLPEDVPARLLDGKAGGEAAAAGAVADMRQALQSSAEQAAGAAVDAALASLEGVVLPTSTPPSGFAAEHATAGAGVSPSARGGSAGSSSSKRGAAVSAAVNATRLGTLLSRMRDLQGRLAASESRGSKLAMQAAAYEQKFAEAKEQAAAAAEAAHAAAVAPLQAEVGRLQERVAALQERYQSEVTAIKAAARQRGERERADAQGVVDRLTARANDLQQRLQQEGERAQEMAGQAVRLQEELANHTQRATVKIETQEREVSLLKERVRELEARDVKHQTEIAQLKQQGQ